MRKILSIDGGGIRGIVPALLLARLEERCGKPVSQLFDLIAGTSTGGILALGLVKPGPNGLPQYAARELAQLYEERGSTIFGTPVLRRLTAAKLLNEKYPSTGIETVLREYFGDARLKDAVQRVLVTSYEIERRTPFFFRSSRALVDTEYDFPMWQVARATSAAPTYFEPARIDAAGAREYWALIDGGVFANNPAMCAYVEARQLFPNEELLVVSLGTGSMSKPIPYSKARNWGLAGWAKPILDVAFDGVSMTVDYQLRHLLPPTASGNPQYFRLQVELDDSLQSMDNASEANLRGLKLLAEKEMRERQEEIDKLCAIL